MRLSFILGCCAAIATALGVAGTARAESPLADAAMHGDRDTVRRLLRQSADVDAPQADGMTALLWAAHLDDVEMADRLLDAGADIGAGNRTGATALYLATVNGSARMIERLLEAGENPNAVLAPTLETVLHLTAKTGNPDAVELLLDRGAEVDARQVREYTPLMFAAAEGHADVIRTLIARGADPGATTLASTEPERRPAGGMTALLFAARQGHGDAARALIEGGADIDQTSADNMSPLLIAVINGHYELASMLLGEGADPSLADDYGRGPLYAAIDLRNVQWSQAPAPHLPQAEHMAMIEALLDAGADVSTKVVSQVNHRGSFDMRWTGLVGGTPFLRAAWNGDIEIMRLLLEHGADPFVETEQGETALLLLAGAGWPLGQGHIRGDEEIVASLDLLVEELGQDVNATTVEGITPLMCAVFKGTNDVIQYLVDHGARLDAVDNEGRSVLTWAAGVAANMGQPPRPQPESEQLLRELMVEQGITIAMLED